MNWATNLGMKLYFWSVFLSQCWNWCQLSIYYFLASSLRNPPITSRRSVSSQLLVSASMTKFFRKNVRSSPTFPENDLGVAMDLSLLDCPRIIHSATCLFLSSAWFQPSLFSITGIFRRSLGHHVFFLSGSSLLLLLSSPLSLLVRRIFLLVQLSFLPKPMSLSFPLLGLFRNIWLDDEIFCVVYSRRSSASSFSSFPLSEMILMVD